MNSLKLAAKKVCRIRESLELEVEKINEKFDSEGLTDKKREQLEDYLSRLEEAVSVLESLEMDLEQ